MTRSEILQVAKPILFSTEMVRAILDGRKTVTRRVVRYKYDNTEMKMKTDKYGTRLIEIQKDVEGETHGTYPDGRTWHKLLPYIEPKAPYKRGGCLYVRETWERFQCVNCNGDETGQCFNNPDSREGCYVYRATHYINGDARWRPSIHMPKEAARIFLRVTNVRVERLNEISMNEIAQEGIQAEYMLPAFHDLWDSTIPPKDRDKYGWAANPWVFVIEFERVEVTE